MPAFYVITIITIIITIIYLYSAYSLRVHKCFTLIKKSKIALKNKYNLNKSPKFWDQSLTYVHKKVCLKLPTEWHTLSSHGRAFQSWGAHIENALNPYDFKL